MFPINNPSDLVVSKDRRFLYSIADEGVESFRIEKDGDLTPINKQWIGGMSCLLYTYPAVSERSESETTAGSH